MGKWPEAEAAVRWSLVERWPEYYYSPFFPAKAAKERRYFVEHRNS